MNKFTKLISLTIIFLSFCQGSFAQSRIKAYFNHPVNNSVSTGVNAVYLPSGTMGDTIVAYINRAKYSIDIAQYDYNQDTYDGAYANIATAVNNAYTRGLTIRWIYDGSSSNGGLSALNHGIHTLGSPTTSAYGIMHNKFIIIDANSTNHTDQILCTGSEDWSSEMMYNDYNNILFIQDSALAYAYTAEFNMMWGSATATPNSSLSKFGPYKTDLGLHTFNIDGKTVNLYFSPSDGTNAQILNAIATANTDLYFGVYCFTRSDLASAIVTKKTGGVYTLGIVDQYTATASAGTYSTLTTGLGSSLKEYTGSYIYHNKMMIVDPSNACSDPQVLTGSHNWTSSATEYNDENTLIIHSDTLANIYYQSFYQDFTTLGGSLVRQGGCGLGVPTTNSCENNILLYPNPANGIITISYQTSFESINSIVIYNCLGQKIASPFQNVLQPVGEYNFNLNNLQPGIYLVQLNLGASTFTRKLTVL